MPKVIAGKKVLGCSCGFKENDMKKGTIKEKVEKKETHALGIVEKEQEIYPITEAECPKCGHRKAYVWTVQTRSADEPETKFLKCEKCKSTWRDYS